MADDPAIYDNYLAGKEKKKDETKKRKNENKRINRKAKKEGTKTKVANPSSPKKKKLTGKFVPLKRAID